MPTGNHWERAILFFSLTNKLNYQNSGAGFIERKEKNATHKKRHELIIIFKKDNITYVYIVRKVKFNLELMDL